MPPASCQMPIYFDYAASTPIDSDVVDSMHQILLQTYGNPSAKSHRYGWLADQQVQQSRQLLAEALGCEAIELIWTSGATESDNLALQGWVQHCLMAEPDRSVHVISSLAEHKAVLACLHALERHPSVSVTYLPPGPCGRIVPDQVVAALRPNTRLVSLMQVNNELGGVTDIAAISAVLANSDAVLHVDAAQSLGKIPVDLADMGADMVSFSAHKCYGPKGVGGLYVRKPLLRALQPMLYGGGQEQGVRSGTIATHQVAGFAVAVSVAQQRLSEDVKHIKQLNQSLITGLESIKGVCLHSGGTQCVPHIVHLTVKGLKDSETLLLSLVDLAVGTGSACNSERITPSHVLLACGVPVEQALTGIRLSLGRMTDMPSIEHCIHHMSEVIPRLLA